MANPNNEINLELTLTTGSNPSPRSINHPFRFLNGENSGNTTIEGPNLMIEPLRLDRTFASVTPILPTSGPYGTDVSHRTQNARIYQPSTEIPNNTRNILMGESSISLREWVPRPVAKQAIKEVEEKIARSYYDFNIQLKQTVADQSRIITKQNETIASLQIALLLATY